MAATFGIWVLGLGISAVRRAWHVRCLKSGMLNPAVIDSTRANIPAANFWLRILNDEELGHCGDLQKLLVGCEIIAALDAVDLLAA
jgi:hypothetical protein